MGLFTQMLSPFVADKFIYVVYDTVQDVAFDKIPVMTICDEKGNILCYRAERAYKVAANVSTHFFEQQYLNMALPLEKGTVRYITDRQVAEQVVHKLYATKIQDAIDRITAFKVVLRQIVGP